MKASATDDVDKMKYLVPVVSSELIMQEATLADVGHDAYREVEQFLGVEFSKP